MPIYSDRKDSKGENEYAPAPAEAYVLTTSLPVRFSQSKLTKTNFVALTSAKGLYDG